MTNAAFDLFYHGDDDYAGVLDFVRNTGAMTYSQFDQSVLRRVNLFALPENFDFGALQEALEVILKTLPSIKRIFAQPITNIKTISEILPIESVRVINNETVVHASFHSELWENITSDGLKPRKLLTQDNRDNYATYENIMFARAVDMILDFVGRNMRVINGILYANRDLKFNFLERDNHSMYFLALGKFHEGYVRDYTKYNAVAENCMEKMLFIDRVIRARLSRPVYKNCCRFNGKLPLKKTNVFRMDKEYHKIYQLLKWFSEARPDVKQEDTATHSGEGYGYYCSLLAVFAAAHFSFTFPEQKRLDFDDLDIECEFGGWRLGLKTLCGEGARALMLTVFKDTPYRVLLLPVIDAKAAEQEMALFKERFPAEEYITARPEEDEQGSLYLSLSDIDSFRRIQQVILRAMIYSDKTRDICPFCGQPLIRKGEVYQCGLCRTKITSYTCAETGDSYFATGIRNFTPKTEENKNVYRNKLSQNRRTESMMYFRNITKLAQNGQPICPKCGHIHL